MPTERRSHSTLFFFRHYAPIAILRPNPIEESFHISCKVDDAMGNQRRRIIAMGVAAVVLVTVLAVVLATTLLNSRSGNGATESDPALVATLLPTSLSTQAPTSTPTHMSQTAPIPTSAPMTTPPVANKPEFTVFGSYELLDIVPHDSVAYTQGVELVPDNSLEYFESTGLYGQSSVRRVDLITGEVVQQTDLASQYFGEGLTHYNGKLIQITWKEQTAFIYNATNLKLLEETTFTTTNNQGWGICYVDSDGVFFVSDGTQYIHTWDASSLEMTNRIQVFRQQSENDIVEPVDNINELEWDAHYQTILANVWYKDYILRIDPISGLITHQYDLSSLYRPSQANVLNGIAITDVPDEIWVTGKLWPNMYLIRLLDQN